MSTIAELLSEVERRELILPGCRNFFNRYFWDSRGRGEYRKLTTWDKTSCFKFL